jgi:hypothetical protein
VRRVGDLALLVVQWALVFQGLYLILVAVHLYSLDNNWFAAKPAIKPLGDTYYIRPSWQRLVEGLTIGFSAIGLAGALFYLRRLYLSRRK